MIARSATDTGWPRSETRKRARFAKGEREYSKYGNGSWMNRKQLSVAEATKRVLAELVRLGVRDGDAIVSTNLQLRLDGLPRSTQGEPGDPGVAVYWQRPGETTRVMAIDRYDRVADNLAAIAATLDAMRAIERHGGAQILERAFTGFDALPPPRSCWDVLGLKPGAGRPDIEAAFRTLAKRHHPDAPTGDAEKFKEIVHAKEEALRHAA
jgi:hypothetical protein